MNKTFIEHSSEIKQWIKFFENAGINFVHAIDYALLFIDNRMTFDVVSELSEASLKSMGITVMGDVLAILKYLDHKCDLTEPINKEPDDSYLITCAAKRKYTATDSIVATECTKSQEVMRRHEKLFGIGRLRRKSIKSRLGPRAIGAQAFASRHCDNRCYENTQQREISDHCRELHLHYHDYGKTSKRVCSKDQNKLYTSFSDSVESGKSCYIISEFVKEEIDVSDIKEMSPTQGSSEMSTAPASTAICTSTPITPRNKSTSDLSDRLTITYCDRKSARKGNSDSTSSHLVKEEKKVLKDKLDHKIDDLATSKRSDEPVAAATDKHQSNHHRHQHHHRIKSSEATADRRE
ncbi:hypothetical protein GJ496_009170 [Pomphorhynchus laevis]|nr:hypothetical protein GJ496_009170 [Pomphorhynchus laevis]